LPNKFELGLPEVTKNYKTPTSCILAKIFPPFQSDDPVIMGFQGRQGVVAVNTPGENAEPIDPRSSASTAVETDLQLVRGLSGIARIQDDDSEKSSSSEKVEPLYVSNPLLVNLGVSDIMKRLTLRKGIKGILPIFQRAENGLLHLRRAV
jgi:hypothetical protein